MKQCSPHGLLKAHRLSLLTNVKFTWCPVQPLFSTRITVLPIYSCVKYCELSHWILFDPFCITFLCERDLRVKFPILIHL